MGSGDSAQYDRIRAALSRSRGLAAATGEDGEGEFRVFYGWIVVAAGFVVLAVGFGAAYSFGAFFPSLAEEFGARRGDVSQVFGIAGFLYFGLGAISGPLADRFGPRSLVLVGMALLGLGLIAASRADTLNEVYLWYGIGVGVGVGCAYVPAVGAVQPWFRRRRGLASGLTVTGIGVGTLAMPPFAAWLIGLSDWRTAYLVFGVGALLIGLVAASRIEHRPDRRGLGPDGDAPAADPGDAGNGNGPDGRQTRARDAVRSVPFWLLYAGALASSFGIFVPFVHLSAFARDLGLPAEQAAGLISLIGLGSILGRFLLGGLADWLGRRLSYGTMFLGMGATLVFWLFVGDFLGLAIFAVLFGTFYGGFVALAPAVVSDYFEGRRIGSILGLLYSGVAVGSLVGPVLAGIAYDLTASYQAAIVIGAVLNALAVITVIWLPSPSRWRAWYDGRRAAALV